MKKKLCPKSAFFNQRVLIAFVLSFLGVLLALIGFGVYPGVSASAQEPGLKEMPGKKQQRVGIISAASYHNDVSQPLRSMAAWPIQADGPEREVDLAPRMPSKHVDSADPVVQNARVSMLALLAPSMPAPIRNFDGIPYPGVGCNCAPPDTNGAVGATQYVQTVNIAFQVFDKSSGTSLLGPNSIGSIWAGFGGVCETGGRGDPIVLYDHIANRWLISQFAGSPPTDECIAISTTNDATGTYNRYAFHLGSNFFNVPKLAVWPDGYYMSNDVLNAAGTVFLGTQAFAFDRAKMLAGMAATFVTPGLTPGAPNNSPFLPTDLDGSTLPPAGAPESFVEFPTGSNANTYQTWHFHTDFTTPANSTFTLFANPPAAGYTALCPGTRACVPEFGAANALDGIGDRLMFRLAYRNFGDHESVVGNFTVNSGGLAAIRWFELRNVTAGPVTVLQESTYQPDATWRWMGSAAMDGDGSIAIGFSASSSTINPQIRYAGRLVSDPINTLAQGETTLFAGTGSQTGTGNRWGDYSAMSVDPVDDHTFWYTNEYYTTTTPFNWRTRIGSFKFSTVPTNNIIAGGSSIVSAGPNGVLDPGETVTVALGLKNIGGPGSICTTALTGALQLGGGVTNITPPASQNYGAVCNAGGPVVYRNFTFVVDPAFPCGTTVTALLALEDGATSYGTVTYSFDTGISSTVNVQNFDGVVAPALPPGWSTTFSGTGTAAVTSTTFPSTAPNDIFLSEGTNVGLSEVTSPPIAISTSANNKVSFRNLFNTEAGFDGLVLEIAIPGFAGGAFQDILVAGGSFASGGYNSTLSTGFGNPLPGRMAWSGLSGGTAAVPAYINTVVNLPAPAAGQNVRLRWRQGSDNSTRPATNPGSRIDTIARTSFVCNGSAPGSITVTSNADAGGICPGASCTLRQAIFTAASGDTINFAAGITTIDLTSGELLINNNSNLTINGPGANLLSVQRSAAAGNFRIFNITPNQVITISGLTIANGQLSGSSFPGSCGGGILNEQSTLTLRNCVLSGNRTSFHGGAILNLRGVVTLAGCTLDQNSVTGSGGAILNAGYNDTGVTTVTLTNCTLNQNQAGQYGGTVYNDGTSSGNASLMLANCTLNQNTAALGASGIYNDAQNPGSSGVANLRLQNTILRAGASGANLVNDGGMIISAGHNLSSDAAGGPAGTGPGGFLNAGGDQRNTDPRLDILNNNGGPTDTCALLSDSPAIDAGNDANAPNADQRGFSRVGVSDIGAFEFNGAPPVIHALGAVSRKMHGGSGTLDVDLPLTGTPGVECRSGGGTNDFTMVVTFESNVSVTGSPQAQVTSGAGTVGNGGVSNGGMVTVSGSIVTIPLTNVADQQTINVTLNGVNSAIDQPAVNVVIPMSRLLGDTTGNRSVNSGDILQVKQRVGQAVSAANFRSDLNANGGINAGDVSIAKQNTGHAVP